MGGTQSLLPLAPQIKRVFAPVTGHEPHRKRLEPQNIDAYSNWVVDEIHWLEYGFSGMHAFAFRCASAATGLLTFQRPENWLQLIHAAIVIKCYPPNTTCFAHSQEAVWIRAERYQLTKEPVVTLWTTLEQAQWGDNRPPSRSVYNTSPPSQNLVAKRRKRSLSARKVRDIFSVPFGSFSVMHNNCMHFGWRLWQHFTTLDSPTTV